MIISSTCLLSWLEQDTSCPTCRMTLNIQSPSAARINTQELQTDTPQPARRQLNHFFHFDGSRYVSWLPSFSVEVSHAQLVRQDHTQASNSQLDAMARQVQTLFPHIPLSIIIDDLRVTRSVELTIENVLDGRLIATGMYREPEVSSTRQLSLLNNDLTTTTTTTSTRNWDGFTMEPVEAEDTLTLGSRFSKSSSEREKILHRRKENLIQNARKRYIEKQKAAAAAKLNDS